MRALVVHPEVLFLDEPFSALDYDMTLFLRDTLQRVLVERVVTTLLVSHDLDEAVTMADHILLLTKRPTRIADWVACDAEHPRTAATTLTAPFIAAKTKSLETFQSAKCDGDRRVAMARLCALRPVIGVVVLLAVWSAVHASRLVDLILLPSPSESLRAFWTDLFHGTLWADVYRTIIRTGVSFAAATLIALPLGILLGSSEQNLSINRVRDRRFARRRPPRCFRCSL